MFDGVVRDLTADPVWPNLANPSAWIISAPGLDLAQQLHALRDRPERRESIPEAQRLALRAVWPRLAEPSSLAQIDACWLPCLPDGLLLEIEANEPNARPRSAYLLWRPGVLLWLDGTSAPLYQAGGWGWWALQEARSVIAYFQCFCTHLANDGVFLLVERATDIPWLPEATPEIQTAVAERLRPLELVQQADGSFSATGTMLFTKALLEVELRLVGFQVEIPNDTLLLEDLPVHRVVFRDGWRVIE